MADYIDALDAHHSGSAADAAARNRGVHDLMRAQEVAVIAALAGLSGGAQRSAADRAARAAARAPTVAVELDRAAEPVSEALGRDGIACWAGDFYAVRPLEAMGIDLAQGRAADGAVHYTSAEDVARLIAALDRVL